MHIIIDATTTQDEMSFHGIGQYTKNIVIYLLKNYPKVKWTILLFNDKESTLDKFLKKYKNCNVEYLGKYRSNNYLNTYYYLIQFLPVIRKIKTKDSIYFCPYFWRNFPAFLMPTVVFIHDMNLVRFNMYSQKNKISNFLRKIQYWKVMFKVCFCKSVICNSNVTRDDFLSYLKFFKKKKAFVSHLGVELEEKEVDITNVLPNDYAERKYIIYLGGGINRSKNSVGVIKGYAEFLNNLKLKKKIEPDDAPYLIISGKSFIDNTKNEVIELHELIRDLGIRDNVVWTGFYDDDEKYSLLKESFVFMHLSLYEGFGISVVEAMRSATPVVVHESDVYKEVVGDGGVFVDGENEVQVGEILFKLFIAKKFTKEMGERGYERSLRYSWDNTAKITYDVFQKIRKNKKLCG